MGFFPETVAGGRLLPGGMTFCQNGLAEKLLCVGFGFEAQINDPSLQHFKIPFSKKPGFINACFVFSENMLVWQQTLGAFEKVMLVVGKVQQVFREILIRLSKSICIFPGQAFRQVTGIDFRVMSEVVEQVPVKLNVHFVRIEGVIGDACFGMQVDDRFHVRQGFLAEVIQFGCPVHDDGQTPIFPWRARFSEHPGIAGAVPVEGDMDGFRIGFQMCGIADVHDGFGVNGVERGVSDAFLT